MERYPITQNQLYEIFALIDSTAENSDQILTDERKEAVRELLMRQFLAGSTTDPKPLQESPDPFEFLRKVGSREIEDGRADLIMRLFGEEGLERVLKL